MQRYFLVELPRMKQLKALEAKIQLKAVASMIHHCRSSPSTLTKQDLILVYSKIDNLLVLVFDYWQRFAIEMVQAEGNQRLFVNHPQRAYRFVNDEERIRFDKECIRFSKHLRSLMTEPQPQAQPPTALRFETDPMIEIPPSVGALPPVDDQFMFESL